MKTINTIAKRFSWVFALVVMSGCKDLTELNIDPNGSDEATINPNLIMPTVLTEAAKVYLDLGFQDVAGVMQHTQKDAWFTSHNDYEWLGSQSWVSHYSILRNNALLMKRAEEEGLAFHQGVALVMKSFMFGLITDLWGDAPYSQALKAELGGSENLFPAYDSQETIYRGILADLEAANTLLSRPTEEYESILGSADVYFGGNPRLWQQFANALQLRYYMRISEKLPDEARTGIERIAGNPEQYPIMTSSAHDAAMIYPGISAVDSWPSNTFTDISGSNYRRLKMCATLVEYMQHRHDPRLPIWAKPVEIPLVVSDEFPAGTDRIVNGRRELSPDVVAGIRIDTDPDYVGLPPSHSALPSAYNLNPTPGQKSYNPHVSYLSEIYMGSKGSLLKARLLSAAEVFFILAEAAWKGWNVGDVETHYNNGIKASLETWTVGSGYPDYINEVGVAYDGRLQQIIEQKWIASWTAATEAWFDYRRTGYPALQAGTAAMRSVLPVRFYYMQDELNINRANAEAALQRLERTGYSQAEGENSAWSKPWLLQGTDKPW
ncbi:SusD/RagB family nutrient-binding outer membrane lipoprotein [Parapedobacter tibetensis]|uniref:SusD/RagB family nutrient-binding outer membrane lipoprotein n=1 Tax=Parapedobacter tibetensis TaxID=2972951 RepID=UPI00214D8428|nr:SusD/RagB family nutrient-binding outer membrane lipoprotein [Parapedobacter tibetensis]